LSLQSCDTVHKAQEEITSVRVVSAGKRSARAGFWQTAHICKANQFAQAQLQSTAHRRGVTESTKHRNQVQLGQTKSAQKSPGKRRHDGIRIPNSSAQAASKAVWSRRSCAAQQQQREKTEKEVGTQKSPKLRRG